jgi:hypothetical protein
MVVGVHLETRAFTVLKKLRRRRASGFAQAGRYGRFATFESRPGHYLSDVCSFVADEASLGSSGMHVFRRDESLKAAVTRKIFPGEHRPLST